MLDVTFREDASRLRKDNAPQNMATLRHMALNILKCNTTRKASRKRKRQMAACEPTFLTELIHNQNAFPLQTPVSCSPILGKLSFLHCPSLTTRRSTPHEYDKD